jgi:hypothetical protein
MGEIGRRRRFQQSCIRNRDLLGVTESALGLAPWTGFDLPQLSWAENGLQVPAQDLFSEAQAARGRRGVVRSHPPPCSELLTLRPKLGEPAA